MKWHILRIFTPQRCNNTTLIVSIRKLSEDFFKLKNNVGFASASLVNVCCTETWFTVFFVLQNRPLYWYLYILNLYIGKLCFFAYGWRKESTLHYMSQSYPIFLHFCIDLMITTRRRLTTLWFCFFKYDNQMLHIFKDKPHKWKMILSETSYHFLYQFT